MKPMQPPTVVPSPEDRIVIQAEFMNTPPELLFDYFVRPTLVIRWWSPYADIHARQGGTFHYAWNDLNLHLRGTYLLVERGSLLNFTWQWDHERASGREPRIVSIRFYPGADGGTRLHISHSPYTPAEQADRRAHTEAWLYYLGRLQSVIAAAAAPRAVAAK
jgi:uncharacterized protein YndB with AHSA1/START domain